MMPHVRSLSLILLLAALGAVQAAAATHTVNQVGLTFEPADITVSAGNTVNWVWSTGSHTVTNGTSLSDPELGTLFDTPLNSAHLLSTFVFTATGDVPYLCRFHVGLGMTGIVHVQAATPVPDVADRNGSLLLQSPEPFQPDDRDRLLPPPGDTCAPDRPCARWTFGAHPR